MNILTNSALDLALPVAAIAQLAIAILNPFLIRIMKWKSALDRVPLLIREVLHIHVIFISITLAIFRCSPGDSFMKLPTPPIRWPSGWQQRLDYFGSFAPPCSCCIIARAIGADTAGWHFP